MRLPDPWANIAAPLSLAMFSGRRAAVEHRFDFWWGRDVDGRRLLALFYAPDQYSNQPRPELNGIEVIEPEPAPGQRAAFILALRDQDAAELFAQLCVDIIAATKECADERSALTVVICRAWDWHSLLRSGRSGRLSEAEQQGLFGELLMLRKLLDQSSPATALAAWRGPLQEPKDFRLGELAIEVKTRSGGRHSVEITSADQLDPAGIPQLILAAIHLAPAVVSTPNSRSLEELVSDLRADLAATPSAEQFEALIAATGWSEADSDDGLRWLALDTEYYSVEASFPRIAASTLPFGVEQVRYLLDLDACTAFAIDAAAVAERIRGC